MIVHRAQLTNQEFMKRQIILTMLPMLASSKEYLSLKYLNKDGLKVSLRNSNMMASHQQFPVVPTGLQS